MVAEFEADLIRMRTREGMQVAKAKGRLRGKQPKLKLNQAKHLLELHDLGTYTKPNSPNSSVAAAQRSIEPLTGCNQPAGTRAPLRARRLELEEARVTQ